MQNEILFRSLSKTFVNLRLHLSRAVIATMSRQLKKNLIEALAEEASRDIKMIDKARDLHVEWVYKRFRDQVKSLDGISAGETETPSADHLSIAHDRVTTIMEEIAPMFISPLKYFCSSVPGTRDAEILQQIEETYGPQLQLLDEADKGAAIIFLIAATNTCLAVRMDKSVKKIKAMNSLWPLLEGLSIKNKLFLALALVSQLAYGGR